MVEGAAGDLMQAAGLARHGRDPTALELLFVNPVLKRWGPHLLFLVC